MNKKTRTELIITAALIAVLLFTLTGTLQKISSTKKARPSGKQAAVSSGSVPAAGQAHDENLFNRLEEESAGTELYRDPFYGNLISPSKASSSALSLNGILWDKTNPMAMINDEVVHVGSRIAGNRVVAIKEDRVILNNGSSDFELRL